MDESSDQAFKPDKQTQELQDAAEHMESAPYVLRLYVAGMTPRSAEAIRRVTSFLEERLAGRYQLEIIDIYQKPALVRGEQIVAVPTLIKRLPLPLRRLIGDMHDEERLLFGLDLKRVERAAESEQPEDSDHS
jgi:circadian clock protein KaiB